MESWAADNVGHQQVIQGGTSGLQQQCYYLLPLPPPLPQYFYQDMPRCNLCPWASDQNAYTKIQVTYLFGAKQLSGLLTKQSFVVPTKLHVWCIRAFSEWRSNSTAYCWWILECYICTRRATFLRNCQQPCAQCQNFPLDSTSQTAAAAIIGQQTMVAGMHTARGPVLLAGSQCSECTAGRSGQLLFALLGKDASGNRLLNC